MIVNFLMDVAAWLVAYIIIYYVLGFEITKRKR